MLDYWGFYPEDSPSLKVVMILCAWYWIYVGGHQCRQGWLIKRRRKNPGLVQEGSVRSWLQFWNWFILTWSKSVSLVWAITANEDREGCKSILAVMKTSSKQPVWKSILLHSKRLTHFDFYATWLLDFYYIFYLIFFFRDSSVSIEFFNKVLRNTNYYISRKVFPVIKWEASQTLYWTTVRLETRRAMDRLEASDLAPSAWETLWWQRFGGRVIKCCSGDTWLLRLIYSSKPFNGLFCFRIYHVVIMAFASEGRF